MPYDECVYPTDHRRDHRMFANKYINWAYKEWRDYDAVIRRFHIWLEHDIINYNQFVRIKPQYQGSGMDCKHQRLLKSLPH